MILAVDLGSTNIKAALYGSDGTRVAEASRSLPYLLHTNERTELSPAAIVQCFHALVERLTAKICCTIRTVSITSQAQTFCVTDENGLPVSPFYGWADIRAEQEAAELRSVLGSSFHYQAGSPEVSPMHMISKVLWWTRANGWSDKLRIVSLPSFLAMQLGAAHVTDTNLAAMTGLFSIPSGKWWGEALVTVGVGETELGSLVAPGQPIPTVRNGNSGAFSENLKVVMAGNDHTSGAVACRCHEGYSTLTLGTVGVVYRHAGDAPGPYSESGCWGPYPTGGYYELLCLDHACSALDWADAFLFGSVDSPRFVERAQRVGMQEKTGFFFPERWGSAQAWVGRGMSKDMRVYAVLEGIAFALRAIAGEISCGSPKEMLILGGGSRLDFLVQLVANAFRRPLIRSYRDSLDGAFVLTGFDLPPDHGNTANRSFALEPMQTEILETRYRLWLNHRVDPPPQTEAQKGLHAVPLNSSFNG